MNEKLNQYLNNFFAPYDGIKSAAELKSELLSDLQERFRELKSEGNDDETAFKKTVDSIGDIDQTLKEMTNLSNSLQRQVKINFTAANLQESDFAGVTLHKGKFKASPLRGANYSGADLTGSSFEVCDAREANFDGANLTDCSFSVTDLAGASFKKSILVRASFSMSGQGAIFIETNLDDVKFTKTDLTETSFANCSFSSVDFILCDLRGIRFDGQTFTGVRFEKSSLNYASFKGAALRNVSFTPPFSLTNKAYLAMQTIRFDGAAMDKITYAGLKALNVVDLSKVTII